MISKGVENSSRQSQPKTALKNTHSRTPYATLNDALTTKDLRSMIIAKIIFGDHTYNTRESTDEWIRTTRLPKNGV